MDPSEVPGDGFGDLEDFFKFLKSRVDDIEYINLPIANNVTLTNSNGDVDVRSHMAAQVKLVGDDSLMINHELLEKALNDGLFNRLSIPIRLLLPPDLG